MCDKEMPQAKTPNGGVCRCVYHLSLKRCCFPQEGTTTPGVACKSFPPLPLLRPFLPPSELATLFAKMVSPSMTITDEL